MKKLKGIKKSMSMYDSANGKTLFAYNMVDATHLCKGDEVKQLVIKYTKSVDGTIAQICNMYEKGVDLSVMVHYNIERSHPDLLCQDEVFDLRCNIMNCDPLTLAKFIFDNK